MSSKYVRFKYTENELSTALNLINAGQISLNKASSKYGIPKSTLHNKLKGKVPNVRKMGPSTVLTFQEEERLANWILAKAKLGFPMHPEEIKTAVQNVLKACPRENKFTDDKPGEKWLHLFLQRHPEISKRNTEIISKGRASVTEVAIRKWFDDLREYLKNENMLEMINDPSRIFNADETGVKTSMQSGLVLGPTRKNFRNLYEIAQGNEKESITVLCNYAANGVAVPPMIVFPYKRIPKELALSVPKGWAIGRSDSGWMTSAVFFEYVANVFYPWLMQSGIKFPVILFIDGHKSHYNLELYEFCVEKRIIIYCLYPNATHILQPCDVAIFRPLKVEWKVACRAHKQKTSTPITRHNFCAVFKEAFEASSKPHTIINGFKACGLYPLDAEVVDYSKCISTRRHEIFQKAPTDELLPEDYQTSLKVMEHYFGTNKFANDNPLKNRTDDIYSFWNFCKLHAGEQKTFDTSITEPTISNHDITSEPLTESFLNNLPLEIDGILYAPCDNSAEIVLPILTNIENDMTDDLESKLDCLEIIEYIIESVFRIVESRSVKSAGVLSTNGNALKSATSNKNQINIISNIVISQKDEDSINKLWNKHLHWPKEDVRLKKRGSGEKMPYAIVSDRWVEYQTEQERKKTEKEDNIRRRKIERELKKSTSKNAKGCDKKAKHKNIVSKSGSLQKANGAETEGTEVNENNPDVSNKVSNTQNRKRKRGMQIQIQEQTKKKIQETTEKSAVLMVANEGEHDGSDGQKKDFKLEDYVLVLYRNKKYPGVIKGYDIETKEYEISVMEKNKEDNWIWPRVLDQIWYKEKHVLKKITEPIYDKCLNAYIFTCPF